jgi:prophage antirepressor-like protein
MRNLYNYVFKNEKIKIIMDGNKKIWFVGNSMAKLLNYKAPKKAIQKYIPEDHKKEYKEIKIKDHKFTKELQKKSTMIDEIGLYRLSIKSKQKIAIEFQNWLTDEVLPSLRENGKYELPDEMKNQINTLIKKYVKIKKENLILIDKLKNDPHKSRGANYIKPVNYNGKIYYKLGKYTNYNSRKKAYQVGQIKDEEFTYIRECNNALLAEKIIKYKLRKCRYTPDVEIYTCKLTDIKKIIKDVTQFVNNDLIEINSNNEYLESVSEEE